MVEPVRKLLLWISDNPWMARRLPRYGFVKRAVARFMPGEEAEDALAESHVLEEHGITALLTLLGENVATREEAEDVARHYMGVVDAIADKKLGSEISIKPTQLGLDLGLDIARTNLARVVSHAEEHGNFVWIDMESSAYTDVTLEMFREICGCHRNVGLCLQSYLFRTESDLASLLPLAPAIRLVKGAYAEPASIAFARKADVDANYLELSRQLLARSVSGNDFRVAIATHDLELIRRISEMAKTNSIPRSRYEIQMLYGVRGKEQRDLAKRGYRVRTLISYGPSWFPWYMRRLAERPANLAFVLKSLLSSS